MRSEETVEQVFEFNKGSSTQIPGKKHLIKVSKFLLELMSGRAPLLSWSNLLLLGIFFLIGLLLTWEGHSTWDSIYHLAYNKWLQGKYLGQMQDTPFDTIKWYGPLWEYPMALTSRLFAFLHDPMWIRHATTFVLLPTTLILVCRVLVQSGEKLSTGILASAMLFGLIRFGGHSVLNIKDFPFACGYLLSTLYLFRVISSRIGEPENFPRSTSALLLATIVSVATYLLRAPVIHHFAGLILIGLFIAIFESKNLTLSQRVKSSLLPLIFGLLIIWSLWPTLWEAGLSGWLKSFGLFSKFAWTGKVRFFGITAESTNLPTWYAPAWILASYEPISFVLVCLGSILFLSKNVLGDLLKYGVKSSRILFKSLSVWLAIFAVAPWLGFFVMKPVFYDEERHLLFALAPLAIVGAIGLRGLSSKIQYWLVAAIAISSIWSYAQFGKLAYVYKSPLVGDRRSSAFMGDYWGVSVGAGAKALYDYVPDGSTVVIMGPRDALILELQRFDNDPLRRPKKLKTFYVEDSTQTKVPLYVLAISRNGMNVPILRDVEEGKATMLWQERVSFDSPYIVLARYDQSCDYCHMMPM